MSGENSLDSYRADYGYKGDWRFTKPAQETSSLPVKEIVYYCNACGQYKKSQHVAKLTVPNMDPEKPDSIIIYCINGDCRETAMMVKKALEDAFAAAYVIKRIGVSSAATS